MAINGFSFTKPHQKLKLKYNNEGSDKEYKSKLTKSQSVVLLLPKSNTFQALAIAFPYAQNFK